MPLPEITQEAIIHIDGTPNEDYPLRILRAYRENCNCRWESPGENELLKLMNLQCEKRAAILDRAISILEGKNGQEQTFKNVVTGDVRRTFR